MNDFGINEMLEMQKALQEKYKDKWEGISPEIGKNKLLWMVGEIGEVIDVIKKNGDHKACEESAERSAGDEKCAHTSFHAKLIRSVQGTLQNTPSRSFVFCSAPC